MMLILLLVAFVLAATAIGRRFPRVALGMGLGVVLFAAALIVSVAVFGGNGP
jgi:hypothetical protein